MALRSVQFVEFDNAPARWELKRIDLKKINLFVGKNSTGKTRVLNVISGLCQILSGQNKQGYPSGRFLAEIEVNLKLFTFCIAFDNGSIVEEYLKVDGAAMLTRGEDGRGSIYYAESKSYLDFQVDRAAIAFQTKLDKLQHPYIVELSEWAANAALYRFGSDMGKTLFKLVQHAALPNEADQTAISKIPPEDVLGSYLLGFTRYKEEFDRVVLENMSMLGYDLTQVGAEPIEAQLGGSKQAVYSLYVDERNLGARVFQLPMSQGMFRSLALVIQITLASLSGRQGLLMIDDLGEGLDYERARCIIDLAISRAQADGIQLVMTSNDRFVMNKVPLEHWSVLEREGSIVTAYTQETSPESFSNFKFLGLSNFDFFTSGDFKH